MNATHAEHLIDQLEAKHSKEIRLTQRELLKHVPKEGTPLLRRKELRMMIKMAFVGGALCERHYKSEQGKN